MVASNPRSANACESCRRRKVKCSGEQPCQSCIKHNWECVFGHTGRRRYSEAQVKHLLEKIRNYEEQLASQSGCQPKVRDTGIHIAENSAGPSLSSPSAPDTIPSRPFLQPEPASPNTTTPVNHVPDDQPSQALPYEDRVGGISPATDLTSGPAFESQVRSLLDKSRAYTGLSSGMYHNVRGQSGLVGQWASVRGLVDAIDDHTIPSLEKSQHLLDQFLYYLGVSQHFFDPRSFSDAMVVLFQSTESREQQQRTTWYTEYLLVMAMATLMEVEQPTSQPPGSGLFASALKRLPPLHNLGEEGIIAVEILALVATYLQWCDRKHDAYLYIGLAMRLAIAFGCDLPENEQACLPSQRAHRVRLWWTVYMLDRRLSSGLGLAVGADERQLRAEFPRHAVGFQSPVAITINVRIARITDEIMCSLYGNTSITQLELVRKIQAILQELYDIGRSFPQSLVLDFSRPLERVTRTGSSLYLMLFQAIILCTRPILLRRVRLEVQRQRESLPAEPVPGILSRLCDTCYEAAMRSLAILDSLRKQGIIPRYGFFDLDATFSAAFVLLMAGFTDSTQDQPPPALDQAFHVLQFLSRSGNSAAEQRFQDIAQTCSHVWPNYTFQGAPPDAQNSQTDSISDLAQHVVSRHDLRKSPLLYPSALLDYTSVTQDHEKYRLDESRLLEPWNDTGASDAIFDMEGDWGMDLTGEAEGIYSSFHNPILPLTGVDYVDWLEIEKVFNAQVT